MKIQNSNPDAFIGTPKVDHDVFKGNSWEESLGPYYTDAIKNVNSTIGYQVPSLETDDQDRTEFHTADVIIHDVISTAGEFEIADWGASDITETLQ